MPQQFAKYCLLLIAVCIAYTSAAQQAELPRKFYTLQSPAEQVIFLRKTISDSMAAGAYTNVPSYAHRALALVPKLSTDTVSADLYQNLADAYESSHPDSSGIYYRRSLDTRKNIQPQKKLYLLQSLLEAYAAQSINDSILHYIHLLEKEIEPMPDTGHNKLMIMNTLAKSYGFVNQYENGIAKFRAVIKNALIAKDSLCLRNAFVNTGTAYNETGNDRMAVYYTMQAIPYLRDNAFAGMVTYNNLGGYFASLQNFDSASIYFAKAGKLADESGDEDAINSVGIQRANIMVSQGKFAEAETLLKKGLAFYEKQEPGVDLVNTLLIYAGLDTSRQQYDAARMHLLKLKGITKTMHGAYYGQALEFLISVSAKTGDYRNAYEYQREYMVIKDSIRSDKVQQSFALLQTEYETYKKEEQIKTLKNDAKISELELSKARRNKIIYLVVGLLLVAAFGGIWYLRNFRNKIEMRHMKAELEMKALRSQMNPHFIFNSLNSIQKYIWENRQDDASEYLTKFARLIRLALENSQHAMIRVSDELDALRLYIEMEHRRNNGKFDYSITTAENTDTKSFMIPPLLLQPYVENAIWHGLSRKEERGSLLVHVETNEDMLICTINDDGVGRAQASASGEPSQKKSMALNISSQRLEWLEKDTGKPASAEIIDLVNGDQPAGTKIIIRLPIIPA